MPIRALNPVMVSGMTFGNPWVGPMDHPVSIPVNVAALTTSEVDANGYLKPGVPFLRSGALVTAGAVFGVTIEPVKVAKSNSAADLTAAGAAVEVAVGTIGQVNRAIIEDNLGRALTAAEVAGFSAAGSLVKLIA